MAMAYAFGSISGGAFNPAVAVGICIMQMLAGMISGFTLLVALEVASLQVLSLGC
jgi:hypothetical protein